MNPAPDIDYTALSMAERALLPGAPETLPIWTLYERPMDYPRHIVARRFLYDRRTDYVIVGATLDAVRAALPPGLRRIPRSAGDAPAVVESWL